MSVLRMEHEHCREAIEERERWVAHEERIGRLNYWIGFFPGVAVGAWLAYFLSASLP